MRRLTKKEKQDLIEFAEELMNDEYIQIIEDTSKKVCERKISSKRWQLQVIFTRNEYDFVDG